MANHSVMPTNEGRTDLSSTAPGASGKEILQRLSLPSYEVGQVIGKGGMGEVLLAHDPKLGRSVAIKRLLGAEPTGDAVDRFLREAMIQARLDHPAIVPVYELGHDAGGRPYFTMKRVAGTTLYDVLRRAHASPQPMLRAFVDVCLAIEFAHSRGVIHRDLKPANIMLGDYGEVYVLDWGIARVIGERESTAGTASGTSTLDGHTELGAMLGTLGYMAPEQVRGDADVGPAADVYSLGAMLFEVLAGESLHPLGHAAIATTLSNPEQAPARRAPDRAIAPELDAACAAALAAEPAARPSARALGDRIQHYLDGDRDVEQRRALAAAHLAQARKAALDPTSHVEALQLAGRALALDPEGKDAAALVTSLMLAPPSNPPPGLDARLREVDAAFSRRSARVAVYSLLAFFAFIPLLMWSGFTAPIIGFGAYVAVAGLVVFIYRFGGAGGRPLYVTFVGFALLAAFLTRVIGPFIVAPAIIGIMAMGLLAHPDLMRRPVLVLSILVAAFLGPVGLEAVGAFAHTWSVVGGSVVSSSAVIHLGGAPTAMILIFGNIATIVITGLFSRELSVSRREAQRSVEIHAWRLQQLLPVADPRSERRKGVSGGTQTEG